MLGEFQHDQTTSLGMRFSGAWTWSKKKPRKIRGTKIRPSYLSLNSSASYPPKKSHGPIYVKSGVLAMDFDESNGTPFFKTKAQHRLNRKRHRPLAPPESRWKSRWKQRSAAVMGGMNRWEIYNLVGGIPTPLKNMKVNGKIIPYMKWKVIIQPCSKPPTR